MRTWETADGRILRIREMETQHIVNCIFMLERAIKEDPALAKGIHAYQGKITNQKLAETFNKEYTPLETLL